MQLKFDMTHGAQTATSSEPLHRLSCLLVVGGAAYLCFCVLLLFFFFFFIFPLFFYIIAKSLASSTNDGMPVFTVQNMHLDKDVFVV